MRPGVETVERRDYAGQNRQGGRANHRSLCGSSKSGSALTRQGTSRAASVEFDRGMLEMCSLMGVTRINRYPCFDIMCCRLYENGVERRQKHRQQPDVCRKERGNGSLSPGCHLSPVLAQRRLALRICAKHSKRGSRSRELPSVPAVELGGRRLALVLTFPVDDRFPGSTSAQTADRSHEFLRALSGTFERQWSVGGCGAPDQWPEAGGNRPERE